MTEPNWTLDDDYATVTVTFPTTPPARLRIDVSRVEDMIRNLGTFRGMMKPPIPQDWEMGQKVEAVADPPMVY